MIETIIRPASRDDLEELLPLDAEVRPAPDLAMHAGEAANDWLPGWIDSGECFVVTIAGGIAGYGILHHHFFHSGLIEMVVVRSGRRRQGIGRALVRHLTAICRSPRIWTSTNLSNQPMQALLASEGFKMSGFIEGLDDGDPELVYSRSTSNPQK